MAGAVRWGVRVAGSFVFECTDGPSAFLVERVRRATGDSSAQAVTWGGRGWVLVGWDDLRRPDPVPPVRARGWREAWRRRGQRRLWFARRRV